MPVFQVLAAPRLASPYPLVAKPRHEWPAVDYVCMIGLGVFGYLVVGPFILMRRPHPVHWAAGLAGAVLGVPVGWLWYRWRGDVF